MLSDEYFKEKAKETIATMINDVPKMLEYQSEFEYALYMKFKEVAGDQRYLSIEEVNKRRDYVLISIETINQIISNS